jgi:flagellar biosynthetic protein FlhB
MPESAGEKTEEPTQHRLSKAREEGNIPSSQEVPSAAMMGVLLICLAMTGPGIYEFFVTNMRDGMSLRYPGPLDSQSISAIFYAKAVGVAWKLMPFLVAGLIVSVLSSLLTSGWSFSPKSAKPDITKLDPIKGTKKLFSPEALMNLLKSLVKLSVIALLSWWYLDSRKEEFLALRYDTPTELVEQTASLVLGLLFRVVPALVIIAVGDMIFQKWNYKRKLKMTKHEVKEENKQQEGDPAVKSKRRGLQMEAARKRMLADVATADVVVTNPTHYAVALRYVPEENDAPVVVAKGADLLCARIKDRAREHDVPIMQRPHLARSLYATTEIGQSIPAHLFTAVAEVLAVIFSMRRKRQGMTPARQANNQQQNRPTR